MTVKKNLCPVTALDPVCLYFNNFWWVLSGFEEPKVPLVMMSTFVEHSPGVPRMTKAHEHQDRGGRHQRGQLSAGMVGDMFQSSPLTGRLAAGPQLDLQLTRLTQLRHCKMLLALASFWSANSYRISFEFPKSCYTKGLAKYFSKNHSPEWAEVSPLKTKASWKSQDFFPWLLCWTKRGCSCLH